MPSTIIPHPSISGAALVPLTKGRFSIIDATDADAVAAASWWLAKQRYACGYALVDGAKRQVYLHRFIARMCGFGDAPDIDHRNHDGLDNRRANLRPATHAQNMWNGRTPRTNSSGYRGVSFHKGKRRWEAVTCVKGRSKLIGRFKTPKEAADAYDRVCVALRGEFAITNAGRVEAGS